MISEPTYLAAKMVSSALEDHFAQQILPGEKTKRNPLAPDQFVIEGIIDSAFWASLRHEEGYVPKISMAFLPPTVGEDNLIFSDNQRLTPHNLVKLSPAVIRPGVHLGIWKDENKLYIWGTTHRVPASCFVLEVIEAGLIIVKQKNIDIGAKFINIAMLRGNQIKLVDEKQWGLFNDRPDILTALLGFPVSPEQGEDANILVEFALAMRRHGRGALMLIVPNHHDLWLKSIVQPIRYQFDPPYSVIPEALERDESTLENGYQGRLRRSIDSIAGFTAVDGATVVTRNHRLLAFGAKVARMDGRKPVKQILYSEPTTGGKRELRSIADLGGTRHLAAAQFAYDQHDALAMVASQDGYFTVFAWSDKLEIVHAHRIDMLLM